jgi:hypothetical protein
MPTITASLLSEGALVDVLFGLPHTMVQTLRQQLQPIPQARQVRALIDTGAEATCLDPSVLRHLALPLDSLQLANMPAVAGLTLTKQYRASVTLLHSSGDARQHFVATELLICELPLGVLGYHAVIGRDMLDELRFVYDGPGKTFTLEY